VIVSQGTYHDFTEGGSGGGGTACVIHNGPTQVVFIGNTIYNCSVAGIISTGSTNLSLIGNVVYDCPIGIQWWGSITVNVVDNTVFDCDTCIDVDAGDHIVGSGNILYNCDPAGYHLLLGDAAAAVGSFFKRSCIYQPAGSARIKWEGGTVYNVADWITAFPTEAEGCIESDPVFADVANDNVDLLVGSPCIGANAESADYATLATEFGWSFKYDKNGSTRPVGAGWDIGACEYGSAIGLKKILFRVT